MADILPEAEGVAQAAAAEEQRLIARLRAGDEDAFVTLVERYQTSLVRVALGYVPSHAVAEEVVQETWIGVLKGIDRFEGRSSLRTWLFRILTNVAKTRGQRESRSLPFSAIWDDETQPGEPAVDAARFNNTNQHWAVRPDSWEGIPEERLLAAETRKLIQEAIDALPHGQQQVITLRDVQGWTAAEVCNVLAISETNQRVLLHRARSRVRRALESYLATEIAG